MSYLSIYFLTFVTLALFAYYIVPLKFRKYILLCTSIAFYLFFEIKYSLFLLFSIITTYVAGLLMNGKTKKRKKVVLIITLLLNIGVLLFVKFANYSINLINIITHTNQLQKLSIIVPIGISFYTLQAVGYLVDVYKEKYMPERNFLKYTSFMSLFTIIVQGPISRFDQLANQLWEPHRLKYDNIKYGAQLALYGFFKKMVIADRMAILVDTVFNNYMQYSGLTIIAACIFYSIQIYTDFSGCVDICRGISQMFGINLTNNFDHPYFATSIKDFWRRWHISLSSWLRDYIYIPLGGNRKGKIRKYINILIVFLVSGLWHGVGLSYIAWGLIHGLYQIIGEVISKLKDGINKILKTNKEVFSYTFGQRVITFILVTFAWIFFRANSFRGAINMIKIIFTSQTIKISELLKLGLDVQDYIVLGISVGILLVVSILQTKFKIREKLSRQNLWFRWTVYLLAIFSVLIFGVYGTNYDNATFLYMQF